MSRIKITSRFCVAGALLGYTLFTGSAAAGNDTPWESPQVDWNVSAVTSSLWSASVGVRASIDACVQASEAARN